ncbi:hypothetical protein LS71_002545 [Helicobacter jaachi]|uniref:Uncharacterized protein n=1 Tax=Helicobacter jaachi TaxID=1677920 RepID=A0A4U8TCG0_9HELI|nr:hypothetical protein [Helicobacter jaachi]TLD97641.1 hypothetical protein LS71_002545 [Helicobacter jaachi]
MGYVIFILTLLLFVLIGLFIGKNKGQFSKKTKIILGISLLGIALLIGLYNMLQDTESKKLDSIKNAFLNHMPLQCKNGTQSLQVSGEHFTLSYGTMSFQGKADSPFAYVIIPLQTCEIKNNKD